MLRDLKKQVLMSQALLGRANLCSVPRGAGPLTWVHETIDYRDSDIYAVTEVYGSFIKWGIPTSLWVSLLNQSNDLDDLGYPPILGNIHIEQKEAMYIAYDKQPILQRHTWCID